MPTQLIKKIADDIVNCGFEVAAIEMSPRLHLSFVHELVNGFCFTDTGESMTDRTFMGLPIIFVHGDNSYYQLLDSLQSKLRLKHNYLLSIYNQKYNSLNIFISGGYKIQNFKIAQSNHLTDLENLSLRLDGIEKQIRNLSHK